MSSDMEISPYQRSLVLNHYYVLDSKGLYHDPDFWSRLVHKLNCDLELGELAPFTTQKTRELVDFCLSLNDNLLTFEEQFFEDYGIRYEDYTVPSIEEDVVADTEDEFSDNGSVSE